MSSGGSISSRISQFGLYRTIDARTEEFLRLSKKRQIKQGCVCAAISTALTVVVVVAIILIYEYNVIAEARRINTSPNWLNLVNISAGDPTLHERFNKANINIDRATLQLLPILLKALSQNRYEDNVVEETTSLYTPYQSGDTTDVVYTRNLFADTRNWMKVPNPRLYAIEYKTSPIVYFKNSTRNVDYFTKIRKIRDYQRMLNYVDKMINEKNGFGATKPMKGIRSHTESPIKNTTPMRKYKQTRKKNIHQTSITQKPSQEKNSTCKCPHKLSALMNKLLASIQQLLSYFPGSNRKITLHVCSEPTDRQPLKNINYMFKPSRIDTKNNDVLQPQETKITPYKTFLNKHKYTVDLTPTNTLNTRKDHNFNKYMSLLKQNFYKPSRYKIQLDSKEVMTTTNSYVESIAAYPKYFTDTNTKAPDNVIPTIADYILQKETYDVSPDHKTSLSSFPDTDFTDDDEYTEPNTSLVNNFNKDGTHILAQSKLKSVIQPERKEKIQEEKSLLTYPFKGPKIKQTSFNNIEAMRKPGNLVPNDKNQDYILNFLPMLYRFAKVSKPSTPMTTLSTKNIIRKASNKSTVNNITKNRTIPININRDIIDHKVSKSVQSITGDIKLTKIINIPLKHKSQQESSLEHADDAIKTLNNITIPDQPEIVSGDAYDWNSIRTEEIATSTMSMIPLGRSTYLEMQRNDWKHDENHDYDNNYIFE